MRRARFVVAIAAALALWIVPASASAVVFIGTTGATGPVNGGFTTVIKSPNTTLQCEEEVGGWKLVEPNPKHEAKHLLVEIETALCALEKPVKASATFGGCAFETGAEEGTRKFSIAIAKNCAINISGGGLKCELVIPKSSNTTLKTMEGVDLESSVELRGDITNMTDEVKGTCGAIESVKGEGVIETDELFAKQLQVK